MGRSVWAMALFENQPVGVGGHQPLESVTEIVGVGVLPAFRRHGIAGALTSFLAHDALGRGVRTVFLSAGDETSGRVYERVGFRRVATACIAEPRRSR
jgi:predicted GNAT family acetyltransferase